MRMLLVIAIALLTEGARAGTNPPISKVMTANTNGETMWPPPTQLVVRAREVVFPDNTTQRTAAVEFPSALTNGSFSINGVPVGNAANIDTTQAGGDRLILGAGITMMTMYDLDDAYYDEGLDYRRIDVQALNWTNGTTGTSPAGDGDRMYYVNPTNGEFALLYLSTEGWRNINGAVVTGLYVRPYDRLYYERVGTNLVTNSLTGWKPSLAYTAPPPAMMMQGLFYSMHLAREHTGDVSQAQLSDYASLPVLATSLVNSARTLSTLTPPLSNNAPGTHMETRFGPTNMFIFDGRSQLWFRAEGGYQW